MLKDAVVTLLYIPKGLLQKVVLDLALFQFSNPLAQACQFFSELAFCFIFVLHFKFPEMRRSKFDPRLAFSKYETPVIMERAGGDFKNKLGR